MMACFVTFPMPSHYLNKCWILVNWTPGKRFLVKFQSKYINFINGNLLKMLSSKWRPFGLGLSMLCRSMARRQREWKLQMFRSFPFEDNPSHYSNSSPGIWIPLHRSILVSATPTLNVCLYNEEQIEVCLLTVLGAETWSVLFFASVW